MGNDNNTDHERDKTNPDGSTTDGCLPVILLIIVALLLALSACAANASVAETNNTRYVTTTKMQLDNGKIIYSWLDEQIGVVCFGSWDASTVVQGIGVGLSCVPLKDTNYALPVMSRSETE